MSRRNVRIALGVLVAASLLSPACRHRDKADAPGPSAAPTAPADAPVVPLTATALAPVIREVGAPRAIPDRVVIELARAVQPEWEFAGASVDGIDLRFEPPVAGGLRWTGRSTLTFTPTSGFAPRTSYVARLTTLRIGEQDIAAENGGWTREFTTPEFRCLGAQLAAFDASARTASILLSFSGPVDGSRVESALELALATPGGSQRLPVSAVRTADDAMSVTVETRHASLEPDRTVSVKLDASVPLLRGGRAKAPAFETDLVLDPWLSAPRMAIRAAQPAEGTNGFYVEVVCHDEAVSGRRGYWDPVGQEYFHDLSMRCLPTEASARELIKLNPAVPFTIAPGQGGFRVFGDFPRGPMSISFGRGLRTADGGILRPGREATFSVPARAPRVNFVSKGRYLPRSAWTSLPIQHLNVDEAALTIRHVPPENLVYWMSSGNEQVSERESNLVASRKIRLTSKPDVVGTAVTDVAALVPATTRGLLAVNVVAASKTDSVRLVLTDMQIVAKLTGGDPGKPWGQQLHAWIFDAKSLGPLAGVQVDLVRRSGQVIATAMTQGSGAVTLDIPAAGVDPSPPFAIVATHGSDLSYLAFDEVLARVEDARVSGEAFSGARPHRGTIWTERGVYRPGETARVSLLVRDENNVAPKPGMPVKVRVTDPRGQTVRETSLELNAAGLATLDVAFPAYATTGRHAITALAGDVALASARFHVEEFVPERMKVEVVPDRPRAVSGEAVAVTVRARYLFGGVPAQHRVELTCTAAAALFTPTQNANFHYGPWTDEAPAPTPRRLGVVSGTLDDDGVATLSCPAGESGALEGPARLVASAAVFEAGSGRTTLGEASLPLLPGANIVGLSSRTARARAGEPIAIEGVVVDADGKLVSRAASVSIELWRLEPEHGWWMDEESGRSSRQRTWRRSLEGSQTVTAENGKFVASLTPSEDSPGFLVTARLGSATTELRVEGNDWGWWWDESGPIDATPQPARPQWLPIEAPQSAKVGEPLTVKLKAPWRGRILFTAETDRVLASEWRSVDAGPTSWTFRPKAFTPNVYITALLVKDPRLESPRAFLPDRAHGVVSVELRADAFRQHVTLDVPKEIRSSAPLRVAIDAGKQEGPAFVTVAAVDEGILSLTKFRTPDPLAGVFERRALGVNTYETIGWTLLLPPAAAAGSTGGDRGLVLDRVQGIKPVSLWSGVVPLPASGKAEVVLDVPQHRGALRVMAVVASATRAGSADASVVVRDPLTLDVTMPRFLMRGDRADIPVFVTNTSGSSKTVEVTLAAEPLEVGPDAGPASPVTVLGRPRTLNLADGEAGVALFAVRVTGASGAARLTAVASAGSLRSVAESDVPLLPDGPRSRSVERVPIEQGATVLTSQVTGWLPMSERTTFRVTSNPHADALDNLKWLLRYPHGCLEQTTSTTRPLIVLQNLVSDVDPKLVAAGGIEAMARAGLDRVLSMQLPSGGFSYWPGGTDPAYWASAYATHLLIDAKARNYPVPQDRIDSALAWMEDRVTNHYEKGASASDWYSRDAEAYIHYVLALGGRPRKARAEAVLQQIDAATNRSRLSEGERLEARFMLQAALWLAGDRRFEKDLRQPDLSAVSGDRRDGWSFYSDRRRRGFMLSTYVDLFGKDAQADRLALVVAEGLRDARRYTTQEVVWGVTGLGKLAEKAADFDPPVLRVAGRVIEPGVAAAGQVGNARTWLVPRASERGAISVDVPRKGDGKLFMIVSSEGVRENATWEFGGKGLTLTRRYRAADGSPVDPESVRLGDVVQVELEIANTGVEKVSNVALVDRIPAGWEIENPRLSRGTPPEWLPEEDIWEVDHVDVRDDRFEAFGALDPKKPRRLAYSIRAVTAGRFALPPSEAEAMYDPAVWARAPGGFATVAGPWQPVAQ